MNVKVIVAAVVVVVFLVFGAISFMDSNVEYTDFSKAEHVNKKVQVKGTWLKERETEFDAKKGEFSFYMVDDNHTVMKVVLAGAKPNNFEVAKNIVARGRYRDGCFYASDVLTKCPSKYDADASAVKKTL